eukprot:5635694-Prymnesium_polylepis.1
MSRCVTYDRQMSETRPWTVTGRIMPQKPPCAHRVDCALKGAIEPRGTARAFHAAPPPSAETPFAK